MIVSFNIEPEDLAKLEQMAGHRGKSKWLRKAIALHTEFPALIYTAEMMALKRAATPRRKASIPKRKKTA